MESTCSINVQYKWTANGVELVGQIPARLTRQEAADVLGIHVGSMTALANEKLLLPLGASGRRNRFKSVYYSTAEVVRCMNDEAWWHKAQYAITKYNNTNKAKSKCKLG